RRRSHPMPTPTIEPMRPPNGRAALIALALLAAGCGHSDRGGASARRGGAGPGGATGQTAGIRVVRPERRDIRQLVVQPGTIEAFETTPIHSRISGYVKEYNFNIGDRVKAGDALIDMWIPDLVEQHEQKSAAVRRAEVQIRVAESALQ